MTAYPQWTFALPTILCMAVVVLAAPSSALAAQTCTLQAQGECCSFRLQQGRDLVLRTSIDTAAQRDYVMVMNLGNSDCLFVYDGAMRAPMRARAQSFKATWLGEPATLSYQADVAGAGYCDLSVYYMTEGYDKFPMNGCSNGHYQPGLASYNKPPEKPAR